MIFKQTARCLTTALMVLIFMAHTSADDWVPLFNGRDLENWTPKIRGHSAGENALNTFRVEDGLLQVRYDEYDNFDERYGHLFFDETFSHYRLRVEYRFVGEQLPDGAGWAFRNSGIMIHGEPANELEVDRDFPNSIEVQLLGGDGTNERSTANLCTPGTDVVMGGQLLKRHCTDSSSKTYHGDDWVTVEIEVRGNEVIRHIIDGITVLEYTHPQLDDGTPLTKGSISVQSESHPIDFRRIDLLQLDATEH